MNALRNKGQALILVMILSVILLISSIGLYFSITSSIIETKNEYQYVKGYYAALAGLRLAYIWLGNPGAAPISMSMPVNIYLRSNAATADIAASLGITAPHDVLIHIYLSGSNYNVDATYS